MSATRERLDKLRPAAHAAKRVNMQKARERETPAGIERWCYRCGVWKLASIRNYYSMPRLQRGLSWECRKCQAARRTPKPKTCSVGEHCTGTIHGIKI